MNNEFLEEISIYGYNEQTTLKKINDNLGSNMVARKSQLSDASSREKVEGISYYNIKQIEKDDKLGLRYSFKFTSNTISDSRAISTCYKSFDVIKVDNKIILTNKVGNSCFLNEELEELNVNIKTNHKVKNNNADIKNDNIYTWKIDKNNYHTKNIYIELYKDQFVKSSKDYKKLIICVIGIAIFSLIVIISLTLRNKKINKI